MQAFRYPKNCLLCKWQLKNLPLLSPKLFSPLYVRIHLWHHIAKQLPQENTSNNPETQMLNKCATK